MSCLGPKKEKKSPNGIQNFVFLFEEKKSLNRVHNLFSLKWIKMGIKIHSLTLISK
jgi:hypothetical protein